MSEQDIKALLEEIEQLESQLRQNERAINRALDGIGVLMLITILLHVSLIIASVA